MKTVGCVKWLETVMNNWVIKWQNEQNMWDFDQPFPLFQRVSVRWGMSQYSSRGMSRWVYTTPVPPTLWLCSRSHPLVKCRRVESPAGSAERRIAFPLALHYVIMSCACACVNCHQLLSMCETVPLAQATSSPFIHSGDVCQSKEAAGRTPPSCSHCRVAMSPPERAEHPEALSGATTADGQSPPLPPFTSHLLPVPMPLVCP